MDHLLPAFADELEKIAICASHASFTQARSGRRPIRAHNLLKKEKAFKEDPDEKGEDSGGSNADEAEVEAGMGMQGHADDADQG